LKNWLKFSLLKRLSKEAYLPKEGKTKKQNFFQGKGEDKII